MPRLSPERRRSLALATETYKRHIDRGEEYLAGRGIDLETARSAGLGVVVEPVPGNEDFVGRLAIPYLTESGPVNMAFRCMEDHSCKGVAGHSKYMFRKGAPTNLYGVMNLRTAGSAVAITEGEIDCITLNKIGVPAIGISGANKWRSHWSRILDDFSAVLVYCDGDRAGAEFWSSVSDRVPDAIRVRMPDGEDVNSVYASGDTETLLAPMKKMGSNG